MSVAAWGEKRRSWVGIMIAGGLVVAAMAGFVGASFVARQVRSDGRSNASIAIPTASSAWDIRSFAAGGKPSPHAKRLIAERGAQVSVIVRDLYDALLFGRGDLGDVARSHFTPPAAAALGAAKIGLPKELRDIQVTKRTASIGIQARGADHAGVRVDVALQGSEGDRLIRLSHRATLWLERDGMRWSVIGFDVNQKPIVASRKG